jgi:excisionase family DNA binding protein
MNQVESKWLTIGEAARYIGMSVGFLRKAVRLRTIPYTRIGTKALRFDRHALDAWMSSASCGGEVNYGRKR